MKALLLVLLLVGCASTSPASSPNLFEVARNQTVKIEVNSDDGASHGTGVLLNEYCVLTVAHVLHGMKSHIMVIDAKGNVYPSVVRAIDERNDIGVACSEKKLLGSPAHIAKSMPDRYAPIFTIGYPLDHSEILTEGRYELHGMVSVPIAPGNSGGPMFNEKGEVVGLADAISIYQSEIGYMAFPHLDNIVEVSDIQSFLDSNSIGYSS